jgi:mannose-6-phosphate isomerase-like protein (cupin superfamily)
MDVRNIVESPPIPEHNGTVPVWYLYRPQELRAETEGGFLELVNEFEVAGGGAVHPHAHPTHEWYYVLTGRGVMTIADEERDVGQGDLVYIPPNVVHSLRPATEHAPIRCFCFAIGEPGIGALDYSTH